MATMDEQQADNYLVDRRFRIQVRRDPATDQAMLTWAVRECSGFCTWFGQEKITEFFSDLFPGQQSTRLGSSTTVPLFAHWMIKRYPDLVRARWHAEVPAWKRCDHKWTPAQSRRGEVRSVCTVCKAVCCVYAPDGE